jgi:hypothetical protein
MRIIHILPTEVSSKFLLGSSSVMTTTVLKVPLTISFISSFDICFLNDIAVANSSLIREYSLVDTRVKSLMLAIKRWAKEYSINSAKDNYVSSYAWMIMVIFYLQWLGFVPNLQCPQLMQAVGVVPDPEGNYWHFVNHLDTCFLTWAQVNQAKAWAQPTELKNIPISGLLYGFFEFYSQRFSPAFYAISIKRGDISLPKTSFRKRTLFFCIEDPFETFDSHCPHDLSAPVSENGVKDMMQFLRDGEEHLRNVFLGKTTQETGPWPKPPFVEPQPPRRGRNGKNPQFSRSGPGRGIRQPPSQVTNGQVQPAKAEGDTGPSKSAQSPGQPTEQRQSDKKGQQNNQHGRRPPGRGRNRQNKGRGLVQKEGPKQGQDQPKDQTQGGQTQPRPKNNPRQRQNQNQQQKKQGQEKQEAQQSGRSNPVKSEGKTDQPHSEQKQGTGGKGRQRGYATRSKQNQQKDQPQQGETSEVKKE